MGVPFFWLRFASAYPICLWTSIAAPRRQWHTSTYVPDRQLMVAFGGESCTFSKRSPGKPGKVKTSDVLTVLDTDLMLWYPPAVTGDVPSGRSGHTATLVDSTSIVVFGGVKGSKWINSLYVLDVDRWTWTMPKVQGVPPKPRSYHTATAISDRRIVVFGGNDAECSFNSVHVLQQVADEEVDEVMERVDRENRDHPPTRGANPREAGKDENGKTGAVAAPSPDGCGTRKCWRWTNPTCRGTMPSPRTGHTAMLLNDQRTICVFGGWDPNAEEVLGDQGIAAGEDDSHMFSNDAGCCFLLDTATWTWRKGGAVRNAADFLLSSVQSGMNGGPQRAGHAAAALDGEDNQVLVFGGRVPGDRFAGDFQLLSGF
jgi:Galactose oxidase, central domain